MPLHTLTRMARGLALAALLSAPVMGVALAAGEYHGNPATKVYHNSGCKHFNCKKCTVVFTTAKTPLKAGYRPCGICKG